MKSSAPSKPKNRKPATRRAAVRRVSRPRPVGSRRRLRAALYGFLGLLGLGAVLGGLILVFALRAGPGQGSYYEIDVPAGLTAAQTADLLVAEGLADSSFFLALYFGLTTGPEVVPGQHLVAGGQTPFALREALSRSPLRAEKRLVVPEGFSQFAIASRLAKDGICSESSFLALAHDATLLAELRLPLQGGAPPRSVEGYLFPATYTFRVNTPAREVLVRMVGESNTRYARLAESHGAALGRLRDEFGWGRAEVVALASMVEKETGQADERALIARVFFNRLQDPTFVPKLLQSDPTTAYGCLALQPRPPSCAGFTGKISGQMNRDRSNTYSTYVTEGLPPGPIANPGEAALRAVLEPATSDALYFVATGGGRHTFSRTLEDHNRAIKRDK